MDESDLELPFELRREILHKMRMKRYRQIVVFLLFAVTLLTFGARIRRERIQLMDSKGVWTTKVDVLRMPLDDRHEDIGGWRNNKSVEGVRRNEWTWFGVMATEDVDEAPSRFRTEPREQ